VQALNDFNGPSYSLFTAGIWITGSSDVIVGNNTVSLHTIGIDCDGGSSRITVVNNVAFHCRDGIWSYASAGTSFSDSTIDGNRCYQNICVGITATLSARNVTISNNRCEYNGIHQIAVASGSTLCTVRRNFVQHGGYYSEAMQLPGSSAFNFYAVGPGNVADGNHAAFQHDVTLNDGNGFIVDTSSYPVSFINNVAYRNEGSGITFTQTAGNSAINNTLVENGYGSTSPTNGAGVRFSPTSTGNTIVNNSFSGNRTCGIHSAGALSSQGVDFNVYAPGAPAIHDSYDRTRIYATAVDVRLATGQEGHGFTADPRFVDPIAPDLRLAPASPAIGRADPTRAPPTDGSGAPRHTIPDIGAFEHQ
jgi:parallel beta-helix repeat protein